MSAQLTPTEVGSGHLRVVDIQRRRVLAAMVEVAAERGFAGATVARVVSRAGVSRRTFYELYEDREQCFLAAFDHVVAWLSEPVLSAYRAGGRWRDQIRAALVELLRCFEDEPAMARLIVVVTLAAGPKVVERRSHLLTRIAAAFDGGRIEVKGSRDDLSPLTAEGIVGAVFSVIHTRMVQAPDEPVYPDRSSDKGSFGISELVNPLMSMIVLPYLGSAVSREELDREIVVERRQAPRRTYSPLQRLDMRLTYRTMRVLLAVGAEPGASNRRVAEIAGVEDQGQISKLLARLMKRGLIENATDGREKGSPNAWRLTAQGEGLLHTVEQG